MTDYYIYYGPPLLIQLAITTRKKLRKHQDSSDQTPVLFLPSILSLALSLSRSLSRSRSPSLSLSLSLTRIHLIEPPFSSSRAYTRSHSLYLSIYLFLSLYLSFSLSFSRSLSPSLSLSSYLSLPLSTLFFSSRAYTRSVTPSFSSPPHPFFCHLPPFSPSQA